MSTSTDYFLAHNLNATTIHTLADDLRRVYGGNVCVEYDDYMVLAQLRGFTPDEWTCAYHELISNLGLNLQPPQILPNDSDPYIDFQLNDDYYYIERELLAKYADCAEQKLMSVYEELRARGIPAIDELSEDVEYMVRRIQSLREGSAVVFYQNYNFRAKECRIANFSLHTLSGDIYAHRWSAMIEMLENRFSDPYFKEYWQDLHEERIKLYKYVKPIMANDHVYYLGGQDNIIESPTEEEFLKRCRDAGLLIYNLSEAIMCPSKRPQLSDGAGWRVAIYDDFKDLRHDGTLL